MNFAWKITHVIAQMIHVMPRDRPLPLPRKRTMDCHRGGSTWYLLFYHNYNSLTVLGIIHANNPRHPRSQSSPSSPGSSTINSEARRRRCWFKQTRDIQRGWYPSWTKRNDMTACVTKMSIVRVKSIQIVHGNIGSRWPRWYPSHSAIWLRPRPLHRASGSIAMNGLSPS